MSNPNANAGGPPGGRRPFKRSWRNYLLDARFQLKFASYIVAVTLVVAALIGVFLWRTTNVLFRQMDAAVDARKAAADTSRELGNCTLNNEIASKMDDPEFAKLLQEKSAAIDAAFEKEKAATVQQQKDLEATQQRTVLALVGGLFAFIVVIALGTIVTTHRIVGPLFRIKRLATEVGQGQLRPPTYGLRPGDELKDVFDVFASMVKSLRDRQEADLRALEAAAQALQAGGEEGAKALAALQAELQARLDR